MTDQYITLFPIQRNPCLTDTEHGRTGRKASKVRLQAGGSPCRADIRAGHTDSQSRSKCIKTTVGCRVQVFPVSIRLFIKREKVEVSVYRSHICTGVVEQVTTYKTIKLVSEVFLLGSCGKQSQCTYQ